MSKVTEESASLALARFISESRSLDIPPYTIEQAKLCILDSIGCMIDGSTIKEGRIYRRFYEEAAGRPESTVVGSFKKLPTLRAANVNGYFANTSDYDDNYELSSGLTIAHPGAVVIPTVLAVAERDRVAGRVALIATVVGYEVSLRIAESIVPTFDRRTRLWGWATHQIFGATAAASVVRGLDLSATLDALGMGGTYAPVPSVRKIGFQSRPVASLKNHYGWAAEGGITAVLLAERGFTASHDILDGDTGFWRMAGSDRFDPACLTADLGEQFKIDLVTLKSYPFCRNIHPALLAMDQLLGKEGAVNASNVRRIRVRSAEKLRDYLCYRPESVIDAQFSLPYAISLRLLLGARPVEWKNESFLADPGVATLSDRVVLEPQDALTDKYAKGVIETIVEIEMQDGEVRVGQATSLDVAKRTFSKHEVIEKFVGLTSSVLGEEGSSTVLDATMNLELAPNLDRLMTALRPAM